MSKRPTAVLLETTFRPKDRFLLLDIYNIKKLRCMEAKRRQRRSFCLAPQLFGVSRVAGLPPVTMDTQLNNQQQSLGARRVASFQRHRERDHGESRRENNTGNLTLPL